MVLKKCILSYLLVSHLVSHLGMCEVESSVEVYGVRWRFDPESFRMQADTTYSLVSEKCAEMQIEDCADVVFKEMKRFVLLYDHAVQVKAPATIVADNLGINNNMHIIQMNDTVKAFQGFSFMVEKSDGHVGIQLLETSRYEILTVDVILSCLLPGDVLIDVGANIGAMSIPALRNVGRRGGVYAFEPQHHLSNILAANAALNIGAGVHPESLHIYRDIVSNVSDLSIQMPAFEYQGISGSLNFAAKSFVDGVTDGEASDLPLINFRTTTLDSIWFKSNDETKKSTQDTVFGVNIKNTDTPSMHHPCPTVLKVDVEKMEPFVLQGGKELISRCMPLLLVEGWDETSRKSILHMCHKNHYTAVYGHYFFESYFNPLSEAKLLMNNPIHNIICVPPSLEPSSMQFTSPEDKRRQSQLTEVLERELDSGRLFKYYFVT